MDTVILKYKLIVYYVSYYIHMLRQTSLALLLTDRNECFTIMCCAFM